MTRVDNSAITKLKCPNCQTVNKRNAAALDFTCASCETKFCLVCNVRYHEKMKCLELKKLVLKKKFEQEEKVLRTNHSGLRCADYLGSTFYFFLFDVDGLGTFILCRVTFLIL